MAAPVGGQVLSEILPYLEINQGNQEEVEKVEEIQTPDLVGETIEAAEKIAQENSVELVIENETENLDKQSITVKEQTPKAGITIKKGSKIYLKWE